MPDMHLDDVHGELLDDDEQPLNGVDALEDLDPEPGEEQDIANLFDLSPEIYGKQFEDTPTEDLTTSDTTQEEADIIADLLKAKGIEDPTLLDYENEHGELEQVNFYELPYDEQLEILKSTDADIDYGLADEELEVISFLRDNNVTFEEAIQHFQRKAVEEHINSENILGLDVDQYADEELFTLDLKSKYPDLTDEELDVELTKQLEHPEVFRKKVEQLRTDYREIEQAQLESARFQQEQADEEKRQELEDALVGTAVAVEELGGLTLDDNDKNEVLSFILEKDINGYSSFIKSLNSPQTLFEAAWFVTKGKEAFGIVHDYYKKEIAQVSKASYERGRQAAQSTGTPAEASTTKKSFTRKVATSAPAVRQAAGSTHLSIDDLTIE
jgi:hypothetical protein